MRSPLRSLIRAVALTGALAAILPAHALETVRFMAPGSPGGGYDQTARTLGKAMQEAGVAKGAMYDNKNGAGGTLGLAQFVNSSKGEVNALCVMGAIMVTGVVQNKPQISLTNVTPIARLFTEYNVIAVRKDSPYKSIDELMTDFKKNPVSVKWGGGSKGSVDHIGTAELAATAGVPVAKVNYVPFGGGGEVVSATLGGHISAITGGYAELAKYIEGGQFRVLAVGSPTRLPGVDAPTLKEAGYNIEIGNWRGVYGAANLTPAQRKELTDAVLAATKTKGWQEALKANAWSPSVITGDEFSKFVDDEHTRLRTVMTTVGLI
ncbi:tripartite tricarboxylate transporter substrate-binding protein [Variovorax sp. NFACC27]|uniref:Bug family tripartite tricarboxylate transporter substrate binding protein n=1 Tax=unclassified Variovorax TaxID=663243 RepID=UPI00089BD718|nr:putative tricarboxylic transport membrane protein [Variovorax sp. NFACC28]SEG70122.1 putative tricarboxylic transport membrane protein [Variovorax sp. NFACC29]SFC83228.1 putative tricarboxylic transport membrane protein [Variovorax sp. NFACC26]SFF98032.1 putative tricarboxylic transport membrane protein [Variovorax sp. NFACC27]